MQNREPAPRANEDGIEVDAMSFVPDAAPNPERLAQSEQLADHMRRALQQLTPAERTAFVMRHWGGSGIEEIAEALKSSSSAAKNTIFRSVQKLRRALEPIVQPARPSTSTQRRNRIMNHPNEEELIAYHGGEPVKREAIATHVADCPECRAELARIDAVLAALSSLPVPDPGADYGARVWQKIAPRLPERPPVRWWQFDSSSIAAGWRAWLQPRRLAAPAPSQRL